MQTLLLRALLLAFIAVTLAAAHSWNTGVLLHLKPEAEFDWKQLEAQQNARQGGDATKEPLPPTGEGSEPAAGADPAPVATPVETPAGQAEPAQTAGTPEQPQQAEPQQQAPPAADGNYITVERARQLFDAQFVGNRQVVFIDARARDIFEKGHVEGAMSLPAGELGPMLPAKVRNYLTGALVVIYCQGAECSDSHDVAKRLQAANIDIKPIFIFRDGYPAWVAAGHPTMAGPEVGWE
jgi:rhodanese-related sulfurtransferase